MTLYRLPLLVLLGFLCCYGSVEGGWCKKHRSKCKKFNPLNGQLEMKFMLDVKCDDGYEKSPTDTTKILCLDGGYKQVPNCIRSCGDLDGPENGMVTVTSTLVDGVATYGCDSGFVMEGSETRTCQHHGRWSGTAPKCQERKCFGDDVASQFNQVCCPSSCGGQCGGPGCSDMTGGADNCCQLNILRANVKCTNQSPAPCVLKPFPPEMQFLLDEISELEQQNGGGQVVNDSAIQKALAEVLSIKQEVLSAKTEIQGLRADVAADRQAAEDFKKEAEAHRNEVLVLQAAIDADKEAVEGIHDNISQINTDIDSKVSEVNNCKAEIEVKKTEVNAINDNIVTLKQQIDATKTDIEGAKLAVDNAKTAVDNAKTAVDNTQSTIQGIKIDIDGVSSQINSSVSEIRLAKSDIDTTKSSIDAIKSQIDTAQADIQTTKTDIEAKQSELKNLTDDLETSLGNLETNLGNPIPLRNPYLGVNYVIALVGIYPARNKRSLLEATLGQIMLFAGNFAPRGTAFCDGALLQISQHQSLFSILGTTYGGDGRSTFALPDLRGRSPIHEGHGPGLSVIQLGSKSGRETHTILNPPGR